jgi:sugar (pentulose or hexulose) kinase
MAIRAALAEAGLSGSQVGAVGLTGQMHGLVLLDDGGQVLRPSILWNDQRTQAECDEIRSLVGRAELIATTGNDALTGFTAPKILWVRADEPEVFDRVRHVLLPKDYVRYRLTGGTRPTRPTVRARCCSTSSSATGHRTCSIGSASPVSGSPPPTSGPAGRARRRSSAPRPGCARRLRPAGPRRSRARAASARPGRDVRGAAHGAAMLAATSQGAFGSVQEAADAIVEVGPVTAPGDATAAYAAAYPLYHDLYPALRSSFAGLSALER